VARSAICCSCRHRFGSCGPEPGYRQTKIGQSTSNADLRRLSRRGLDMVASRTFDSRLRILEYLPIVLTGLPSGGQHT
jgi:hypothetical protein